MANDGTRDAEAPAMGHWGADPASPIGAEPVARPIYGTAAPPLPEERPPQNTPLWMDVSSTQPETRRGATPGRGSGLQSILFFGVITIAVGAAGLLGVAVWGPEKTIKNRTHLATDPPPPTVLPSLPASDDAPPPVAESAPAPADSAAAPAASAKKGKKAPKPAGRKAR